MTIPEDPKTTPSTIFSQKKHKDPHGLELLLSNTPNGLHEKTSLQPTRNGVDPMQFDAAVKFATNRPQVSAHAPVASAILEYLAHTVPYFNKSEFCALAIEKSIKTEYPELWAAFFSHAMVNPKWRQTVKRHNKE